MFMFLTFLQVALVLRLVASLGRWWLAAIPQADDASIVAVICLESVLGGAVTTAMFALMMSMVTPGESTTQYSILSTLEVRNHSTDDPAGVYYEYPFDSDHMPAIRFLARASHRSGVVSWRKE